MTEPVTFLDGRVSLYEGDARDCLREIADASIDSCVTDPPYAIKFMQKSWDDGETAFDPKFWREVLRVLKPGGHLVAFSGTRTYHRMACAIEDAGFEIRDQIGWAYGSGFPKSHDVSKGIDKHGGKQVGWFGPWLKTWREANGIKQSDIAALFPSKTGGKTGCVANWELGFNLPTPEQFNLICSTFDLPFDSLAEAERIVLSQQDGTRLAVAPGQGSDRGGVVLDITAPATEAAIQWQGWGTALKPSWECICLGRKPLSESTIAGNVLRWGTGALNIDGCRVETDELLDGGGSIDKSNYSTVTLPSIPVRGRRGARWPANLVHDGSEEVVGAFPETGYVGAITRNKPANSATGKNGIYGKFNGVPADGQHFPASEGSAARFFYTAKADADDRLGSKHPTVKPVDLMRWLCRLITPPGGTILDPFAGTGTTAEAAFYEGFNAVMIEREAEYQADISRRMKLVMSGPDERVRESMKARFAGKPQDAGPLFGGHDTDNRGLGLRRTDDRPIEAVKT